MYLKKEVGFQTETEVQHVSTLKFNETITEFNSETIVSATKKESKQQQCKFKIVLTLRFVNKFALRCF